VPEIHAEKLANLLENSQETITKEEILELFLSFHNLTLTKLEVEQGRERIQNELKEIGTELGFHGAVIEIEDRGWGDKIERKFDIFDGKKILDVKRYNRWNRQDRGDEIVISKSIIGWILILRYVVEDKGILTVRITKDKYTKEPFNISILLEKEDIIIFDVKIVIFLNAYNIEKSWNYESIPRNSGNPLTDLIDFLNQEPDLTAFKIEEAVKLLTFEIISDNSKITINSGLLELVLTDLSYNGWNKLKSNLELCVNLFEFQK
jgi:hypothetical protein